MSVIFNQFHKGCVCGSKCTDNNFSLISDELPAINEHIELNQFAEAAQKFNNLPAKVQACPANINYQIKRRIAEGLCKRNRLDLALDFLRQTNEFDHPGRYIHSAAILVNCKRIEKAIEECQAFFQNRAKTEAKLETVSYQLNLIYFGPLYCSLTQISDREKREELLNKIRKYSLMYEMKWTREDVDFLVVLKDLKLYEEAEYLIDKSFQQISHKLNPEETRRALQAINEMYGELISKAIAAENFTRAQQLHRDQSLHISRVQTLSDSSTFQDSIQNCLQSIHEALQHNHLDLALDLLNKYKRDFPQTYFSDEEYQCLNARYLLKHSQGSEGLSSFPISHIFTKFLALIEINKIEEALLYADKNIGEFLQRVASVNESNFCLENFRENMRRCIEQQGDPYVAFRLLNVLRCWPYHVSRKELFDFRLELDLLKRLAETDKFVEFWNLWSQIKTRISIYNYKCSSLDIYVHKNHDDLKNCYTKILEKFEEILGLPVPQKFSDRLCYEKSAVESFNEILKDVEKEQKRLINNALSERLQELDQMKQTQERLIVNAEERSNALQQENEALRTKVEESQESFQAQVQEINQKFEILENEIASLKDSFQTFKNQVCEEELQRQTQYQDLDAQLNRFSSSMNEIGGNLQVQFRQFKQGFKSLISTKVGQGTVRIQNQINALFKCYNSLDDHIKENRSQTEKCEDICKEALEEIRQMNPVMRNQPEIQRRTAVSPQKSIQGILQAFQDQQKLESEKMMKMLRMNLLQNFEMPESQAFSTKRSGPQQEEEKIQARKSNEKDPEDREELDLDQQENEERQEQIGESISQQIDRKNVPSIRVVNNNTWEIVGPDQG